MGIPLGKSDRIRKLATTREMITPPIRRSRTSRRNSLMSGICSMATKTTSDKPTGYLARSGSTWYWVEDKSKEK